MSYCEVDFSSMSDDAGVQACINRLSTVAAKTKMRDRWIAWKDGTR